MVSYDSTHNLCSCPYCLPSHKTCSFGFFLNNFHWKPKLLKIILFTEFVWCNVKSSHQVTLSEKPVKQRSKIHYHKSFPELYYDIRKSKKCTTKTILKCPQQDTFFNVFSTLKILGHRVLLINFFNKMILGTFLRLLATYNIKQHMIWFALV